MTDSVERFSNRVSDYVKYRPGYPRGIVAHLTERCGLMPDTIIADVGCGPGMSTQIFLENGNTVFGGGPNDGRRDGAVEYLAEFPRFTPVKGTSDQTNLPDSSINMTVAAQAFHWFNAEKTRPEFKRIAA